MGNMKIWDAVCETDPANTKKVKFGREFTAIDAYSQIKMATVQFGPYGVAWGIKEITHCFVPNSNMVLAVGQFFIPDGESIVSSSIFYISEKGKPDDDFAKKLETDMITKALSRLGFNADVFMGKFDDNRYVQAMAKKAKEKDNPTVNIANDVKKAVFEQSLSCIDGADENGLREIWAEFGADEKVVLWGLFNSQQRSTMKEMMK